MSSLPVINSQPVGDTVASSSRDDIKVSIHTSGKPNASPMTSTSRSTSPLASAAAVHASRTSSPSRHPYSQGTLSTNISTTSLGRPPSSARRHSPSSLLAGDLSYDEDGVPHFSSSARSSVAGHSATHSRRPSTLDSASHSRSSSWYRSSNTKTGTVDEATSSPVLAPIDRAKMEMALRKAEEESESISMGLLRRLEEMRRDKDWRGHARRRSSLVPADGEQIGECLLIAAQGGHLTPGSEEPVDRNQDDEARPCSAEGTVDSDATAAMLLTLGVVVPATSASATTTPRVPSFLGAGLNKIVSQGDLTGSRYRVKPSASSPAELRLPMPGAPIGGALFKEKNAENSLRSSSFASPSLPPPAASPGTPHPVSLSSTLPRPSTPSTRSNRNSGRGLGQVNLDRRRDSLSVGLPAGQQDYFNLVSGSQHGAYPHSPGPHAVSVTPESPSCQPFLNSPRIASGSHVEGVLSSEESVGAQVREELRVWKKWGLKVWRIAGELQRRVKELEECQDRRSEASESPSEEFDAKRVPNACATLRLPSNQIQIPSPPSFTFDHRQRRWSSQHHLATASSFPGSGDLNPTPTSSESMRHLSIAHPVASLRPKAPPAHITNSDMFLPPSLELQRLISPHRDAVPGTPEVPSLTLPPVQRDERRIPILSASIESKESGRNLGLGTIHAKAHRGGLSLDASALKGRGDGGREDEGGERVRIPSEDASHDGAQKAALKTIIASEEAAQKDLSTSPEDFRADG